MRQPETIGDLGPSKEARRARTSLEGRDSCLFTLVGRQHCAHPSFVTPPRLPRASPTVIPGGETAAQGSMVLCVLCTQVVLQYPPSLLVSNQTTDPGVDDEDEPRKTEGYGPDARRRCRFGGGQGFGGFFATPAFNHLPPLPAPLPPFLTARNSTAFQGPRPCEAKSSARGCAIGHAGAGVGWLGLGGASS